MGGGGGEGRGGGEGGACGEPECLRAGRLSAGLQVGRLAAAPLQNTAKELTRTSNVEKQFIMGWVFFSQNMKVKMKIIASLTGSGN